MTLLRDSHNAASDARWKSESLEIVADTMRRSMRKGPLVAKCWAQSRIGDHNLVKHELKCLKSAVHHSAHMVSKSEWQLHAQARCANELLGETLSGCSKLLSESVKQTITLGGRILMDIYLTLHDCACAASAVAL